MTRAAAPELVAACKLTAACSLALLVCVAHAQESLQAGNFSKFPAGGSLPSQWTPLTFRNVEAHTRYSLVTDAGVTVLKAESSKSASGLIRRLDDRLVDLKQTPILRWRWKVGVVPLGSVRFLQM